MEFLFRGIARAGGIEVAPEQRIFHPSQTKASRNRTTPGLARRLVADIAGGTPLRGIETGVSRLVEGSRAAHRRRAAIGELSALDDCILQDIGVNRRSIPELVDAQLRLEAEADTADPRRTPDRPGFGVQACAQPC